MAAYLVGDINVTDGDLYAEYQRVGHGAAGAFGGKILAIGTPVMVLEGNWQPTLLGIVKFESLADLNSWYSSPQYTTAKRIRHRSATSNLIVVEG